MLQGNAGESHRLTALRPGAGFAAIAALLLLSGCSSAGSVTDKFFNLNKPANVKILDESFFEDGYCPPIRIRAGTEALVVFS